LLLDTGNTNQRFPSEIFRLVEGGCHHLLSSLKEFTYAF
jgi:hypothetical protein